MSSYAAPYWQSSYLKDTSSLDKITDYYKNLPEPLLWSYSQRPGEDFYEALNQRQNKDSQRFGPDARNAPIEKYITPEQIQNGSGLNIDDNYNATYSRTGRSLGTMPMRPIYGGQEGMHPQYADYYLDLAAELDRIDPNVYQLDVSKVTAPEIKPITGMDDMTPLFNIPKTPALSGARTTPKYY